MKKVSVYSDGRMTFCAFDPCSQIASSLVLMKATDLGNESTEDIQELDDHSCSFEAAEDKSHQKMKTETECSKVMQLEEVSVSRHVVTQIEEEEDEDQKDFDDMFQHAGLTLRQVELPIKQKLSSKLLTMIWGTNDPYSEKEWNVIIGCQKTKRQLSYKRLKNTFHKEGYIPEGLRPEIWKIVCKVTQIKLQLSESYSALKAKPIEPSVEQLIKIDLERTVIDFQDFARCPKTGTNRLFNVLKAYANLDPEVGYMQGMNFIAAMLLMNLPSEEDAFCCLVYLLFPRKCLLNISGKHNWRQIFIAGMPKALSLERKLKRELNKKHPSILKRITEETDGSSVFPAFGSHYVSIFLIDFPYQTARRLFEVFLLGGECFLLKIIWRCIKLKESKLKSMHTDLLIHYLKQEMIHECLKEKDSIKAVLE